MKDSNQPITPHLLLAGHVIQTCAQTYNSSVITMSSKKSSKSLNHLKSKEKRKSKEKELADYFCFCFFSHDNADEVREHAAKEHRRYQICPVDRCRGFIFQVAVDHVCILLEEPPKPPTKGDDKVKKLSGVEAAVPWIGAGRFNA